MTSAPLSRAFVSDIEIRADGTGRTVGGIVVPFGRVAKVSDGGRPYDEAFEHGAFSKTINDRGDRVHTVKLLSQHDSRRNPLGAARLLREDAAGLYGEFKVSKTPAGDDALELLRDGALDSFSVGFAPIKDVKRAGVTWRTEVALREASLVTFPAYADALVQSVRAWEELTDAQRDEALHLLAQATDLRSTTPLEPGTDGTPDGAATTDEPALPLRSVPQQRLAFRLALAERGIKS